MKRCFVLVLLCALLLTTASAVADRRYETYKCHFSLPDSWICIEASDDHIKCVRKDEETITESFELFESRFGRWTDSAEDLANLIKKAFDYSEDARWELMRIDGMTTVLVDIPEYGDHSAYMTALQDGKRVIFVLYTSERETRNKDSLINILQSFEIRGDTEKGFYTFGKADVKFEQFTVKESGGKRRLVLYFTWRNIGDAISSFDANVDVIVFQNGIELNASSLIGNTDSDKRIMPGKELDCLKIFDLREDAGEIIVMVDKLSDPENEYIDRLFTFSISK